MRTNLVTPFAEKDAVKALGARWDPAKKVWYVTDVADLTPFARWIPDLKAATGDSAAAPTSKPGGRSAPGTTATKPRPTAAKPNGMTVAHCGCPVLPWEPCAHSPASREA